VANFLSFYLVWSYFSGCN